MGLLLTIIHFGILFFVFFKVRNIEEMMERQQVESNEIKVSLDHLHEKIDKHR